MEKTIDLSIVIPALNEADNLRMLLPQVRERLDALEIAYEVLVVDELANEATRQVVAENGVRLLTPDSRGYGGALRAGFEQAQGRYIITMDADLSHPPDFLCDLWNERENAEVVIASRYVRGGKAHMPVSRLLLSLILNLLFSRGVGIPARDMSSGYRLYSGPVIKHCAAVNRDFDVLQELLVHILVEGHRIKEIPFHYKPRRHGSSHARVIKFGMAYLRTFGRLWRLRNSPSAADYEWRAYNSWFLPLRFWHRQRYRCLTRMMAGRGKCLHVGCGSSRAVTALPDGSLALDIQMHKLRFARRQMRTRERLAVQGSLLSLPVKDGAFPCVLCSQVVVRVPRQGALDELDRVLAPGGMLVLGTPDYSRWQWLLAEKLGGIFMPRGYTKAYITHTTRQELIDELVNRRGYTLEAQRYVMQGELILQLRKSN